MESPKGKQRTGRARICSPGSAKQLVLQRLLEIHQCGDLDHLSLIEPSVLETRWLVELVGCFSTLLNVVGRPKQVCLLSHQSPRYMGRFFLVSISMLHHSILSYKAFPTNITGEWLFSRVQAHVASQVGLVVELFWADFTLIRLVSGVLR